MNLLTGTVTEIEDPCVQRPEYVRQPTLQPAGPLPFALLFPSTAPEVVIPTSDLEHINRKKTAYLEGFGISIDFGIRFGRYLRVHTTLR